MSSVRLDETKGLNSARQIKIVGAGFTGLTLAYFFVKRGWKVKIIEKTSEVGGLIHTRTTEHGMAETAANGVFNSQLFQDIAAEIGVELLETKSEAKKRFLYRDHPQRWPFSFRESFRLVCLALRLVFAKASLRPESRDSVRSWGTRHLGSVLSRFSIETFLQGVYAGDPAQMSAEMILQKVFAPKKRQNWDGYRRGTLAPREGMGQFIEHLFQWLVAQGVVFEFTKNFVLSNSASGDNEDTHATFNEPVILATPGHVARKILESSNDPRLLARAQGLAAVHPLALVTVTVFWPEHRSRYSGFGCLFPPGFSRPVLGILMNSLIFENRSHACASETYILGGALHAGVVEWTDAEILNLVVSMKNDFEGFAGSERMAPLASEITRWPRAFPHYTVELNAALKELERHGQGIYLAGNYLGKIGLAQMLQDNFELAEKICQSARGGV